MMPVGLFFLVGLLQCNAAFLVDVARPAVPVQQRAARAAVEPRMLASTPKMVKLGLVGGGTVGGGIVEILSGKKAFVTDSLGVDIQFSKIVVRDPSKPRDFAVPDGCEVVGDVDSVINDP